MCEFNIQLQIKERLLLYKVDLVQIGEKILFSRQLQGGLPSYRGGPGHVEGDLTALRSCGIHLKIHLFFCSHLLHELMCATNRYDLSLCNGEENYVQLRKCCKIDLCQSWKEPYRSLNPVFLILH